MQNYHVFNPVRDKNIVSNYRAHAKDNGFNLESLTDVQVFEIYDEAAGFAATSSEEENIFLELCEERGLKVSNG